MVREIARIAAFASAMLSAGCLDFKEQTVTYRYDSETDTLRVFQEYRGIFGDSQTDTLTKAELEELNSVVSSERTFFFANWMWELNREELAGKLDAFNKRSVEERTPSAIATAALQRQILDALRVKNGAAYFDAHGRLSAVQQVTLTHVTALIAAANDFLAETFRTEASNPKMAASKRERYIRALEEHREYIVRRGHAFFVRLPVTREEFDDSYSDLERLSNGGINVVFANDEMTWQIGVPSDVVTAVTMPVSRADYVPNAVASFRRCVTVLDSFDPSEEKRGFLSTGASRDEGSSAIVPATQAHAFQETRRFLPRRPRGACCTP